MSWFQHRHWWRRQMEPNPIMAPNADRTRGLLIVEECGCGAVRTIECVPGTAPVVRYAETPA